MEISDAGDVLGTLEVPGTATSYYLFFWTPLSPSRLTVFAPGGTLVATGGMHMNDEYFIAMNTGSNYRTLYSYDYFVDPNGDVTFVPTPLSPVHPGVWGPNSLNHGNQTSCLIQARRGYDLGRYNIDTGVSTKLVSGISNIHLGLNDSGDILFIDGNRSDRLYRTRESTSYKLYDILSTTARAELYNTDGSFRFGSGMRYMLINDSNVAGLPVDPNNPLASFDHISGSVFLGLTPGGSALADRAFILTPRKK